MKKNTIPVTIYIGLAFLFLNSCKDSKESNSAAESEYLAKLLISQITSDDVSAISIVSKGIDSDNISQDSMSVKILIKNKGSKTLWYHGDSDNPFVRMEYLDDNSNNMIDVGKGYCGTGAGNHPIKPNQEILMKTFIRQDLMSKKHRIGVPVTTSPTANNYVWVMSPLMDMNTMHDNIGN